MKAAAKIGESAEPAACSPWDILASLGDSLAVVDPRFRLVWAREPLLGKGRESVWAGQHCYRVFAGRDHVCQPDCPVQRVLETGRAQASERQIVLADGRVLWRETRAYPVRDRGGRLVLVARISFDVSRRKARQSRQERAQAALERSLAAQNRLGLEHMPFQADLSCGLTARELEVLRLLSQGLSKPQIAKVLGLSAHTVKRHVDHIFTKLGVGDRAQAAVWAARQGLV